jgi:hypothetical protein
MSIPHFSRRCRRVVVIYDFHSHRKGRRRKHKFSLLNDIMSVSAEIQKFETGRSGRVEYFIKVVFHGRVWAIRKRFSDFVILDRALRHQIQNSSHSCLPALPPKEWFGIQSWKKDTHKLVKRQRDLQKYLHVLLNDVISNDNSLVKEFLEVEHNNFEITKRLSRMEISRIDAHRRIVESFLKRVIPITISFKYILSPKRNNYKYPSLGSGKGKFNRSRSATSISSGCGSLSTPSARISKESQSQFPLPEASSSFDLLAMTNGVTTLSSLKSPSNSAKLIAQESNTVTKEIFFEHVRRLWSTYESDINKLMDLYESNCGCSGVRNADADRGSNNSSEDSRVLEKKALFSRRSGRTPGKNSTRPIEQVPAPFKLPPTIIEILMYQSPSKPFQDEVDNTCEGENGSLVDRSWKESSRDSTDDTNPKEDTARFNEKDATRKGELNTEPPLLSNFIFDPFCNTTLEDDRSLVKDIHSSSFAWTPSIRKMPPLANPVSKVVSLPVNISRSQLQLSRKVES